ncbi:MAG: DMT family transporter [Pseudomonadota bacterium]
MDRKTLGSVALMFVAMSLIPLGDAAGKLLIQDHGAATMFVAFSRFLVGAGMVLLILGFRIDWRLYLDWRVWLRAAFIAGGIGFILTALRTEDIATVFGAFFVGPIFSYVLSIWLLGERVRPWQTVLLGVGFCGVLLVVKPGFGMTPGLAFAVCAGLCYGAFLTASKWLATIAAPRQLMLSQTLLGTLMLAPMGVLTLPDFTPPVTGLTLVSGLASASGNLLLILAFRREGATTLAPFVYFQLIAATVYGVLIFGSFPDPLALLGLVMLVSAGFATLAVRR